MHLLPSIQWRVMYRQIAERCLMEKERVRGFASGDIGTAVAGFSVRMRTSGSVPVLPVAAVVFPCAFAGIALFTSLPDISDPKVWNPPHSIPVQDRNGKDMYVAYGEEERVWVGMDEVPDHVKNAFIALEDRAVW